ARLLHAAMLLPTGDVLVAGGFDSYSIGYQNALSTAEIYQVATGIWTTAASMNTVRAAPVGVALPSGKILVAAGIFCCPQSLGGLNTAELYDPTLGTWSYTGPMIVGRGNPSAVLLPDGEVLVAGGITGPGGGLNFASTTTSELYDPVANSWTAAG